MSEEAPPADLRDPQPPEGFVLAGRRGPFSRHNGPFYMRAVTEGAEHGFFALDRHCNALGIVHGGMLASFLDGLLGHAVSAAVRSTAVTIHLSLDYLSMARAGDWVQGRALVTRKTRDVVFVEATAFVGARSVVRATSIFKVMDRHATRG